MRPQPVRPMKSLAAAIVVLIFSAAAGRAQAPHPCAADAIARGTPLLKLHFGETDRVENLSVDDKIIVLAPVRALKGNGRFDVLEVWGYIYKARYRMRFIYAQMKGSCVL